ncbi:Rho termination factor [Tanacetum coccineum]
MGNKETHAARLDPYLLKSLLKNILSIRILSKKNFREACAALCPLGVTNSPLNQTPEKLASEPPPTSVSPGSVKKSSSSPLLLEEPKSLCTHETDVDNPHDMEPYTLVKLKAIAKHRGLTGYSKLKKSDLFELLEINVVEGM